MSSCSPYREDDSLQPKELGVSLHRLGLVCLKHSRHKVVCLLEDELLELLLWQVVQLHLEPAKKMMNRLITSCVYNLN